MKSLEKHEKKIAAIARQIKEYGKSRKDKKLRFYHGNSNSTRENSQNEYHWINISHLDEVIEINAEDGFVLVEPNVPMDKLVAATLRFGLIPPVVMEFPGISVGGAVNGTALESSSFRFGQFNDNAQEYEIILGSGEIIKASAKQNQDIFSAISGAYGSLGLLSLIKLRLSKASKYVRVKHTVTNSYKETLAKIHKLLDDRNIDFLEGIIFSPNRSVIITGELVENGTLAIKTYSKARDLWFYERARNIANSLKDSEELIPIVDYLFRYNRGAFWTGEFVFPFFHIPNNKLIRYLLNPLMNTRKLFDGLHAVNMGQDWLVQDFYLPWNKTAGFLEYSAKTVDIWPIWLCPIKPSETLQKLSPHFIDTDDFLIDVGVWGQTEKYLKDPIRINREFEAEIKKMDGRKMLYAHQYYTENEFWQIYDYDWYKKLREKYKASNVFPDVWTKTHVKGRYKMKKWRGSLKILWQTLQGKHINT